MRTRSPPADTRRTRLQVQAGTLDPACVSVGRYRATILASGRLPGHDLLLPQEVLERALPQFLGLRAFLDPCHSLDQAGSRGVLLGCYEDVRISGSEIVATLRLCATLPANWVRSLLERQETEALPGRPLLCFSVSLDMGVLAEVEPNARGCQVIQRILDVRRMLIAVRRGLS